MNTKRYTSPTGKARFTANGWIEQSTPRQSINTWNEILYAAVIVTAVLFAASVVYVLFF